MLFITKKFKYLPIILLIILFPMYSVAIDTSFLNDIGINILKGTDLFTSIFYFYMGIIIAKYKSKILHNRILCLILLPFAIYFLFFNTYFQYSFSALVVVLGFLLLFNFIGDVSYRNNTIGKAINELSSLTYAMFLLQHVIVQAIIQSFNPMTIKAYVVYLMLSIILTIFFAKISCVVEKSIKKS